MYKIESGWEFPLAQPGGELNHVKALAIDLQEVSADASESGKAYKLPYEAALGYAVQLYCATKIGRGLEQVETGMTGHLGVGVALKEIASALEDLAERRTKT